MKPQISAKTDQMLNQLSQKITDAENLIEEGTLQRDASWVEVYDIFDEHNLTGVEARFIANDGHILYKEPRNGSDKIDEEMLRTLIFKKYEEDEARLIWNSITIQKVDPKLVEAAGQSGNLDRKLINQCIIPGNKTFARIHNKWSKEDKERASILGINQE
jgi:hypothetical protein